MRHNKSFNHLGRTTSHRKAMLANMASSLITNKRINTTVAKAKALKAYIEPLVTKSKDDSTHSRRMVFSILNDKDAVSILFRDIAVKIADRPGGYTRVLKTGFRKGDAAEMAMIEFVDFNETYTTTKTKDAGKKKSRRSAGAKKVEATDAAPAKKAVTDTVKAEAPKVAPVDSTEADSVQE